MNIITTVEADAVATDGINWDLKESHADLLNQLVHTRAEKIPKHNSFLENKVAMDLT